LLKTQYNNPSEEEENNKREKIKRIEPMTRWSVLNPKGGELFARMLSTACVAKYILREKV